jgi:hypothetical protein
MKGIVFAGCSFTYGHGLEYYSPNNEYIDKPDIQINGVQDNVLIKTREELRFPNLVSEHFNTFNVVRRYTAGNDQDSFLFLEHLFDRSHVLRNITNQRFKYNEIEYIIFQTSYPDRCFIKLEGRYLRLNDFQKNGGKELDDSVDKLKDFGIKNFDEYYDKLRTQLICDLKNNFQFYESKGLKCLFWNITGNFNNLINNDEYLKNRLITFDYNGKNYSCWHNMFKDKNYDLEIIGDKEFFGDVTPKDQHPSKKAHKIIAESIIKKIEENEKINQLGKEVL